MQDMRNALGSVPRAEVSWALNNLDSYGRWAFAEFVDVYEIVYLGTAMVLDDQLVQSDGTRMEWFRQLLTEKARSFQIVVFTCRPTDYLGKGARVPATGAVHADSNGGLTRAIDLGRALGQR